MIAARLILSLSALLTIAAGDPSAPQSRMNEPSWAGRFARKQDEMRQHSFNMVLFGDSITHELEVSGPQPWSNINVVWQRWFACRHALDLGFTGDTTANLLWRIQSGLLPSAPPRDALVLIGTNNMRPALAWSADQTASAIGGIAAELRRQWPDTHILLLGIPPNGRGKRVNATIDQVNLLLAARPPAGARFIPTADLFRPDGILDTSLYREPHLGRPALHPDAQGWEQLAQRIVRVMQPDNAAPCAGAPAAPR